MQGGLQEAAGPCRHEWNNVGGKKNPMAYAFMDGCLRSITILNTYESSSPRLMSIDKAVIQDAGSIAAAFRFKV